MSEHTSPLVCMSCGYDLRSQRSRGTCPECGVSVRRSLAHARHAPRIAEMRTRRWALIAGVAVFALCGTGIVFDVLFWLTPLTLLAAVLVGGPLFMVAGYRGASFAEAVLYFLSGTFGGVAILISILQINDLLI